LQIESPGFADGTHVLPAPQSAFVLQGLLGGAIGPVGSGPGTMDGADADGGGAALGAPLAEGAPPSIVSAQYSVGSASPSTVLPILETSFAAHAPTVFSHVVDLSCETHVNGFVQSASCLHAPPRPFFVGAHAWVGAVGADALGSALAVSAVAAASAAASVAPSPFLRGHAVRTTALAAMVPVPNQRKLR
jgi:hypothetical protein